MMIRRYRVDPARSRIGFSVRHLGVSTIRGQFTVFEGHAIADLDHPSEVYAEGIVDVASISTGIAARDDRLRSADFFDAAAFPTIGFRLVAVERVGHDAYRVTGDLVVKGTRRQVTLEGRGPDPMGGVEHIGIAATGEIDRLDFGLNWNGLAGPVPVVGRKVRLELDLALAAYAAELAWAS